MNKYPRCFQKAYTLFNMPKVRMGFGLFLLALSLVFIHIQQAVSGAVMATVPFLFTFDKAGLSGDNLKLIEDLEKRMKLQDGVAMTKDQVVAEIRTAMEKFKDLDIATIVEALGGSDKGLRSILIKQGEEIAKLQKNQTEAPVDMSIRGQLGRWAEQHKDIIAELRAGKQVNLPALILERRAPITMTNATSLGGSVYLPAAQVLPGVNDFVRPANTFWSRLTKLTAKANPLVWVNKTNKQGAATFIGEGVLKPLASFELSTESSTPKKAAERMKVSTEMLYDLDGLASMIEAELQFEVEKVANDKTIANAGSSTEPKGITNYATLYTQTGIATTAPNNADAIYAAITQLVVLGYPANSLVAMVHPVDLANMNLQKASDGHYVLPPFMGPNGTVISGVPVIPEQGIAIGKVFVGDITNYKIYIHQPFFISWGWENDDFSKNLVTVIGEIRFHQFVSANKTSGFLYDTFANIKTAITAV